MSEKTPPLSAAEAVDRRREELIDQEAAREAARATQEAEREAKSIDRKERKRIDKRNKEIAWREGQGGIEGPHPVREFAAQIAAHLVANNVFPDIRLKNPYIGQRTLKEWFLDTTPLEAKSRTAYTLMRKELKCEESYSGRYDGYGGYNSEIHTSYYVHALLFDTKGEIFTVGNCKARRVERNAHPLTNSQLEAGPSAYVHQAMPSGYNKCSVENTYGEPWISSIDFSVDSNQAWQKLLTDYAVHRIG